MEREESEDAQYSELITTAPVDTPVKSEDTAAARSSPDGEGLSTAALQGLCQRESYCLLVRVARNVDSVSALNVKVPDYVWNEVRIFVLTG